MGWARVATVDEVNGEVVAEALGDAGIEVRLTPLPPHQVQQLVTRRRLDVEVDEARQGEARALLDELAQGGEAAALAQAEATLAPAIDDEAGAPRGLLRRALGWLLGTPPSTPRPGGANPPAGSAPATPGDDHGPRS